MMQYHPDPLIRVFDMRMLRQASPLSLTIPGTPVSARFLPSSDSRDRDNDRGDDDTDGPCLVAVTSEGCMQSLTLQRASLEQDMGAIPEVMYSTLLGVTVNPPPPSSSPVMLGDKSKRHGGDKDNVTCLAVASGGRLVATGSSMGTLSLNALLLLEDDDQSSGGAQLLVNQVGG
jgi:hypothetical protein